LVGIPERPGLKAPPIGGSFRGLKPPVPSAAVYSLGRKRPKDIKKIANAQMTVETVVVAGFLFQVR
jgi:hypothetical protein